MTLVSRWRLAGKTARGKGHIPNGIPCQDRISLQFQKGIAVMALADGAGSRSHSHIGAEVATRTICKEIIHSFDSLYSMQEASAKKYLLTRVLDNLEEKSETIDCEIKSLASTLLFVAANTKFSLAGHLGDGVIGVFSNGEIQVYSEPHNFEFPNMTIFTTSTDAIDAFRLYRTKNEDISGFVVMSDGAGHSLYHKSKRIFGKAVDKMFGWFTDNRDETTSNMIGNALRKLIVPRTQDDCSLALMRLQFFEFDELLGGETEVKKAFLDVSRIDGLVNRINVLKEYIEDRTLQEIDQRLQISSRTIRRHLNALRCLGISIT